MREIKFRAVIPERNATIYFDLSDLIHPSRKDSFSQRELLIPWLLDGNKPDVFTGLKDKNGVEIYEGDIIKDKYYSHGRNGVVTCGKFHDMDGEYYPPCFGYYVQYSKQSVSDDTMQSEILGEIGGEVIGNISENPELLETK